jgi:signal peptidase I
VWVVAIAAVALGVMKLFFVDLVSVADGAMAPTIFAGDLVALWRGATPELGDVVLCAHPRAPDRMVLGRVVGLPGTLVASQRGELTIEGRAPDRDVRDMVTLVEHGTGRRVRARLTVEKLGNDTYGTLMEERTAFELRPTRVQDDALFLLNDFRSWPMEDSRAYGPVRRESCRGVVFMRLRPGARASETLPQGWLDFLW